MQKAGRIRTYRSDEIDDSHVSIGFECLDRDVFKPERCYDLLAKTGVKHARCQTGWSKCEKEKGVYDFTWLDSVIDNLRSRGIKPWFNVGFGNPLYMSNVPNKTAVGCVPIYYGDEATSAWKSFVCALAKRYKGIIEHYEIWNEPDLDAFWHPEKPDAADYARLVNMTAKAIKEVDPDAKTGIDVNTLTNFKFIDKVIDDLECLDFFSFHAYITIPEFKIESAVKRLRRKLDESGFEHTEIWQGEAGYPSWIYKGHWLLPDGCDDERAQAIWQIRRYFIDISLGLKISSYFQIADMWETPYEQATTVLKKPGAFGILNGLTYTPKKSYETITYLATVFSGKIEPSDDYMAVYVNSHSPVDICACRTMTFRKNGFPIYAYYMPTSVSRESVFPYNVSLNVEELEDPVLIDMYSGDVFVVENKKQCAGTVQYTGLPITDYPLIVTERKTFEIIEDRNQ